MNHPLHFANAWYQESPGTWLLELERLQLAEVLKKCHGNFLMQVGGTDDLRHSADSPIKHRFHLVTDKPSVFPNCWQVQTHLHELPIQPESLDAVLLLHVLEFTHSPVQLLKDIFQTLTPGGQLIILGFNPWSYWGIHRMFAFKKTWPWNGKFWSRAQIKQWLRSYPCHINTNKTICFRSPHAKQPNHPSTAFIETLGQFFAPTLGGVYLIAARKKVYCPTKQMAFHWKKRPILRGVAQPTRSESLK